MSIDYTIPKDEIRAGRFELNGVAWVPERTCRVDGSISWDWTGASTTYEHNLTCGHTVTTDGPEPPSYCPECGARVVTND